MFDLRKIPMLRVLIPFVGGLATEMDPASGFELLPVFSLLFFLTLCSLVIFLWQGRRPASLPWINSLLLFLVLFLAGMGTGIQSRPRDPGLPVDRRVLVRGELCGPVVAGESGFVFEMSVRFICSQDSTYPIKTRLRCYLPEPSDSLIPAPGETWQFIGSLAGIRTGGNPGMPDYRAIMGRKNCWYRFYVFSSKQEEACYRKVAGGERSFSPARMRLAFSEHWKGDADELSLLKAVCLGDRSSLSEDILQSYSNAGGMHLLAVSGLHVGLIWWVLQVLTGWMRAVFRSGKEQSLLVLGILWFYALVTGFSSSVCRSVTMFSFFSLSRMRGEGSQTLNAIFSSAFLLLLVDPVRLADVGFQLSYAAITGIVTLHPLALKMFRIKNRVLKWIWEATSVSLAAQLVTAPLVIYYFHQLPLYSLFTSLVAIPLLSVLIAIFVCSVPLVAAGILKTFSSFLLVQTARIMNVLVEFLSALPGSVLEDLHMQKTGLLFWLLALVLIVIALHVRKRLPVYLILALIPIFLLWHSWSALKRSSGSELVIAHFRGASHLSFRSGIHVDHYCWYRDSTSLGYPETFRGRMWNGRIYENRVFEGELPEHCRGGSSFSLKLGEGTWLLRAGDISALVLRGPAFRGLPVLLAGDQDPHIRIRPDFILLSGDPRVNVKQIDQSIGEMELVIDGSNGSWYRRKMMEEWDKIYLTDLEGAYGKRW